MTKRTYNVQSDGGLVQTDGRRTQLLLCGQSVRFIVRDPQVSIRKERRHATHRQRRGSRNVLSELTPRSFFLKTMSVCIKEITPILRSCELFQEVKGSFKCSAEVFLSLDSADCAAD
ncbi:hypothetical protein WMY93_003131 [Mugilogobius chulae]|uniref:Uncharacterized protein n=1 Tax=Mugilogobius chulae TaxID=88201 RepID=A0AAW0PWL1_9GOBI